MNLSKPVIGVDGAPIDSIFIPVQSTVIIGIAASNTDRDVWGDDAHEWKPERWLVKEPCQANTEPRVPGVYNGM